MAELSRFRNSPDAWGPIAVGLHWLLALLIAGQFALGWIADEMPALPAKFGAFVWHKSLGVTILLLVFARLVWRLADPAPALPGSIPPREQALARVGQGLLYLLMFAVPISGWIVSDTSRIPFRLFGSIPAPDFMNADRELSELAARTHWALVISLAVVVTGHVVAALRHQFVKRNGLMSRMLPFRRSAGGGA